MQTLFRLTKMDVLTKSAPNAAAPPAATNAAAPAKAVPAAPTETLVPFGVTANGGVALSSFQPTVASLALQLGPHMKRNTDVSNLFPLPTGLLLQRSDTKKIQLRLAPFFARKLKRVFRLCGRNHAYRWSRGADAFPAASGFACTMAVWCSSSGKGM